MEPKDKFPKDNFPEGTLLENRYRLTKYLAEGGFGAVFAADQECLGHYVRRVAVKITKAKDITPDQAGDILVDAMILARVIDEIKDSAAKRFLVRVYDMGVLEEHDRRGFIIMEFVPGMSLADKMEHYERMPEGMCLPYVRQVCIGLSAMHGLEDPVIHRDLKPDNVLLTEADEVRVVDFGLAARIERVRGYVEGAAGTEGYMAPETSIRHESSCASDVYSLGVMMYEMLTGVHPFRHLELPRGLQNEDHRRQWLNKQKERNAPKPPSRLNPTVSEELDAIVMRCLKYHDYDRFPNANELLKALDKPDDRTPREGLFATGLDRMKESQWSEAELAFGRALSIQPQPEDEIQFKLYFNLALVLLEQGKWSRAVRHIHNAEDLNDKKLFLATKEQRAEFNRKIADICERNGNKMMALKYRNREREELPERVIGKS